MERYLYLSINVFMVLVTLLASVYFKTPFYKKWKLALSSAFLTAIIFIVWSELFTMFGIWGFNERYLIGIKLAHLPIEVVMFHVCVPFACIFIYFALSHLVEKDYLFPHQELISSALILLLLVLGMHHYEKLYTGVTFVALALLLAFIMLKLRPRYMGRFYFAFGAALIPFFIVNGILTGFIIEEVVWFNAAENSDFRLFTIPIENVFYGMLLMLLNIVIYEWLQMKFGR